jgi:hypothetical protein
MSASCRSHDQFTSLTRIRLKTTSMGLGLVRLLLDARRTEEARTTLSALHNGVRGRIEEAQRTPRQHLGKVIRLRESLWA